MEKQQRIRGRAIVTGLTLIRALGYNNARAFQRARQMGVILVPLYPIPGQSRGLYAFLDDLKQSQGAANDQQKSNQEDL